MKFEIFADRETYGRGVAIHIRQPVGKSGFAYAKPIAMERGEDDASYIEPCLRLDMTSSQRLMDELWNCGIRPTEGTGSAGSLRATERHLEDMRRLVFEDKP